MGVTILVFDISEHEPCIGINAYLGNEVCFCVQQEWSTLTNVVCVVRSIIMSTMHETLFPFIDV